MEENTKVTETPETTDQTQESFKTSSLKTKPSSQQLIKIVLLLILALLAVIGLVFAGYKIGKNKSKPVLLPTTIPTSIPTTVQQNTDLQFFSDDQLGFSVNYPKDWKVLPILTTSLNQEREITNCQLGKVGPMGDQGISEYNNCASFDYMVGIHYNQDKGRNITFNEWVSQNEQDHQSFPSKLAQYNTVETTYRVNLNVPTLYKNIYIDLGNSLIGYVGLVYAENYPQGKEVVETMYKSLKVFPKPIGSEKTKNTGWLSYQSPKYTYSFEYPNDWNIYQDTGSSISITNTKPSVMQEKTAQFMVSVSDFNQTDLEKEKLNFEGTIQNNPSRQEAIIAGIKGDKIVKNDVAFGDYKRVWTMYFMVSNGKVYEISTIIDIQNKSMVETMNNILLSFKFL